MFHKKDISRLKEILRKTIKYPFIFEHKSLKRTNTNKNHKQSETINLTI